MATSTQSPVMSPQALSQFLAQAFSARLPVLITGAPGIGKTDIVSAAAAAAGCDLILSHPVVEDPTNAKGLPWPDKDGKVARFLPFGELARAVHATKPTVWFLDDLGQAPPMVQASYMQLLLARCVNDHKLPDCVTFAAATNRRTDRAGVSGILEPVKSRFASIVELQVNVDDWCAWAMTVLRAKLAAAYGDAMADDIVGKLVAFMRFKPEHLCNFVASADLTNSPLPRTWAHAAKLLGLPLPPAVQLAAISGAVGQGAAIELSAFMALYAELPTIESILDNPDASTLPTKPGTLYAVVTALGMRMTMKNFPKVARYAERLWKASHGEFAALLLRDCVRKDSGVMSTTAFVKLASDDLGALIAGSNQ
jgi:hypothetical protein